MKNLALAGLIKRAAEDIAEKEHSSADPSLVDRLVMGPLANNVAREAEVTGGAGLKGYLYPTLAGAGGAALGGLGGALLGDYMDWNDDQKALASLIGSGLGGALGLNGGIAGRNAYMEKKHPGFTTPDITVGAHAQRNVGGTLGSGAGAISGGLLGALGGGGLGFLVALAANATDPDADELKAGAGIGAGIGGSLGAVGGGLLGNLYGQDVADTWRQKREAKEKKGQEKKASSNGMGSALGALAAAGLLAGGAYGVHRLMNSDTVQDYLAEQADKKSMLPETLSTTAGAGVGAGGMYGLGKFAPREETEISELLTKLRNEQKVRRALNASTPGHIVPYDGSKVKDVAKGIMHSVTEPRTLDELSDARKKLIGELKAGKTGLGKALKFLGKNKKFAIPGAALAAGASALGLHNLID
jgi:hypothetical protein